MGKDYFFRMTLYQTCAILLVLGILGIRWELGFIILQVETKLEVEKRQNCDECIALSESKIQYRIKKVLNGDEKRNIFNNLLG